ncbi:15610_t:CDS:1, partial [Gigaspora rosea]
QGINWPSDTLFVMYVRGINNNLFYWKDPDKFIPERFYKSQNINNLPRLSFSMFSGNLRACIGKNLAIINMKLFLLYRNIDVELVDLKAPLKLKTFTTTFCENFNIKITISGYR